MGKRPPPTTPSTLRNHRLGPYSSGASSRGRALTGLSGTLSILSEVGNGGRGSHGRRMLWEFTDIVPFTYPFEVPLPMTIGGLLQHIYRCSIPVGKQPLFLLTALSLSYGTKSQNERPRFRLTDPFLSSNSFRQSPLSDRAVFTPNMQERGILFEPFYLDLRFRNQVTTLENPLLVRLSSSSIVCTSAIAC